MRNLQIKYIETFWTQDYFFSWYIKKLIIYSSFHVEISKFSQFVLTNWIQTSSKQDKNHVKS
jgi:hypothetical protein